MSDLIDREALLRQIDIDSEGEPGYYGDTWKFIDTIKRMPSALGTNLAEDGTDLISRQDAIDTIEEYFARIGKLKRRGLNKGEKAIALDTVGAIKSLPSAQPKRGKWIIDRSGAYCCSECMEPCAGYVMMKPRDKFCKMCGAKMEVTT